MARHLKDSCGIVYLFTNNLYIKEGWHKFGVTINPIERKLVQSNSTPPDHPFEDEIILFSTSYKEIENELRSEFSTRGWLHDGTGKNAGNEWIKHENLDDIVEVYKSMLREYKSAEMCYNGKRYVLENDQIVEKKLPNCRLDFLGIRDGYKIKCEKDGKIFEVKDNGILVEGNVVTLSSYAQTHFPRSGKTNQHNGFQYFTYKKKILYNEWQSLVTCGTNNLIP